jgi:hypothetical protein
MYELSQFKYIECIDRVFKNNFGFLYGSMGKSLFVILYVPPPCSEKNLC